MKFPYIKTKDIKKQLDEVDLNVYQILMSLDNANYKKALLRTYDLISNTLSVMDYLENKVGNKKCSWRHSIRMKERSLGVKVDYSFKELSDFDQ